MWHVPQPGVAKPGLPIRCPQFCASRSFPSSWLIHPSTSHQGAPAGTQCQLKRKHKKRRCWLSPWALWLRSSQATLAKAAEPSPASAQPALDDTWRTCDCYNSPSLLGGRSQRNRTAFGLKLANRAVPKASIVLCQWPA
ncbi:hypothetical protein mRhiFer1_009175 [Rhinolophus ferrumequinum]|uniref:Uncharacterized protein n=1 Tax=Rhinolophus ferrumequinum TaxID=59479 RepID=A0A7J7SJF9_RHIFE|nr:hypothetical protein mRhiFer1_009175 [Rhinolophus ferrumequinum]